MIINDVPSQSACPNGVHPHRNGPAPGLEGREAAYRAALKLVARIDEELTRGIRHYRNRAGKLLTRLDEVIRAILADNLRLDDEEEGEG